MAVRALSSSSLLIGLRESETAKASQTAVIKTTAYSVDSCMPHRPWIRIPDNSVACGGVVAGRRGTKSSDMEKRVKSVLSVFLQMRFQKQWLTRSLCIRSITYIFGMHLNRSFHFYCASRAPSSLTLLFPRTFHTFLFHFTDGYFYMPDITHLHQKIRRRPLRRWEANRNRHHGPVG